VEKIERDRETERWRRSSSGLRWRRMKLYRTRGAAAVDMELAGALSPAPERRRGR
jgi:hypothetical protein